MLRLIRKIRRVIFRNVIKKYYKHGFTHAAGVRGKKPSSFNHRSLEQAFRRGVKEVKRQHQRMM